MKKLIVYLSFILLALTQITVWAQTNDFYDDAPTNQLGTAKIEVLGEVANPGIADLGKLPLRSVICKEVELRDGSDKFIGAYRYDGYSLYDILNSFILKKKNEAEFPPIIDLYVVVTGESGDKAVLSWGEIYYPINRHEIIIATQVARIVPSKSKDLWPLPEVTKLVVASDLITARNISKPVKIEIVSYSGKYKINKGMSPMMSPEIIVKNGEQTVSTIKSLSKKLDWQLYPSVFYGRGMGIHGITDFKGVMLQEVLQSYFSKDDKNIKEGLVVVAGLDGYRCVYSFSEIFNRCDQDQILIVDDGKIDGGRYRLFPAPDFFSDRAIKSVMEIRLVR